MAICLIGLSVVIVLKYITYDRSMQNIEEFYETWYFFTDRYMKRMILFSEQLSEKLQKNVGDTIGLDEKMDIESDANSESVSLHSAKKLKNQGQINQGNGFNLRLRKKKGTLNPLVSIIKILMLLSISSIGFLASVLQKDSEEIINRLSEFTVTVGTASLLNVQLNNILTLIQEAADDPSSRNLASPPLNTLKSTRNSGLPNAISNFVKNQTLNLQQGSEAADYIKSRYFGDTCEFQDKLKTIVEHENRELDYRVDCSTFLKGVMKKGMFAALSAYLEMAQTLSNNVVYYAENKEADWNPDHGLCNPTASLPKFRSNLRCILVSKELTDLSKYTLVKFS